MEATTKFDVIIIGGSYSGLAAGMALGRALKSVLIIDSGKPCNIQTPHSHNFLTQDGSAPSVIAALAKQQVQKYKTVAFTADMATDARQIVDGFTITTASGLTYEGSKIVFATGIRDIMPDIVGFADC
ncbi:MAG TPA: FAD-dependent oxidoreductase, partial [Flavobacterium sp.]